MTTTSQFVHLKVHSEFSLIDGLVRVKGLVKAAADAGMPAVAMTDQCNFFGLIKFYKAANGLGVKPIAGSDVWMRSDSGDVHTLTLLVQNLAGYKNLILLISKAYQEGQVHGIPYIKREWLKELGEGLIALSGGRAGDVGAALVAGRHDEAAELLQYWMDLFPDRYYLELQRTGRENEAIYIERAVALADEVSCPIVATNDVRFLRPEEFEAHEARVCIHDGAALDDPRRERRYSDQQYLRSPEEMIELFADLPDAVANTVEIAKRCSLEIELGTYYLPEFPIPENFRQDPFFKEHFTYETLEQQTVKVLHDKWHGRN
jgi:DNA polymerase-3 subunit alpha